jgi:Protein of unknown function (DUF2970)
MALDPLPSEPPPQPSPEPSAGFLHVLAAVFSSFLGIRKKAAGERDMVTIKPVHVIVAGVLGAAILVAVLVALVSVITGKG